MKIKPLIIAVLAIVALILFAAVGFDLFSWDGHNLIAVGLAVCVAGFILDRYWDATPG